MGEEKKKSPVKVDLDTQAGDEVVSKTIYKDAVSLPFIHSSLCPPFAGICLLLPFLTISSNLISTGNRWYPKPKTRDQEIFSDWKNGF